MAENMFVKGADTVSRFEVKRYGYTLILEISPDGLECHCTYEPTNIGGTPLTEAELMEHLTQLKISEGFIPESASSLLTSAASGKSVSRQLLLRGIPMIPGADGQLELVVADDLAEPEPELDEGIAGTVDFRRVQSFLNVDVGDLVAARILPACRARASHRQRT